MTIQQVIERLSAATEYSRGLDRLIAEALGYKFVPKSEDKEAYWMSPDGEQDVKIPRYTFSLDAAYQLALELCPNSRGGASWDNETGAARIGNAAYQVAATTPIAICVATLEAKLAQEIATLESK